MCHSRLCLPRRYRGINEFQPLSTSTICKIEYKKKYGVGAIYRYEFPQGTLRTLLITSNEILDIFYVNDITELRLEFTTIGNFYITPDWVKWMWTSPQDKLNVTVVEFSITAMSVLSRSNYKTLQSAIPKIEEKVSVYNNVGEDLRGSITNVIQDLIEFEIPETGTAGAPLLNEELYVVGIYNGFWDQSNKSSSNTHKATNIQSVLNKFRAHILEQLCGKTENELWLEKWNQMPRNELQLIGTGGFARVYKIMESSLSDKHLAVKIESALGSSDIYEGQVYRSLENEYRVVTSLGNHPRIIQFYAIIPDQRNFQVIIIMEYMEGGSLAGKLTNKKPLPDELVVKYLVQLLEGLSFLHQKGIYHSDINPTNILFDANDNLKISDFGIANGGELSTKSSVTSPQGNFHYMAPERVNRGPRSAAGDMWSVGATFVHMATGHPLNSCESIGSCQ